MRLHTRCEPRGEILYRQYGLGDKLSGDTDTEFVGCHRNRQPCYRPTASAAFVDQHLSSNFQLDYALSPSTCRAPDTTNNSHGSSHRGPRRSTVLGPAAASNAMQWLLGGQSLRPISVNIVIIEYRYGPAVDRRINQKFPRHRQSYGRGLGVRTFPLFKNMGLAIRPYLRRNIESVEGGWGGTWWKID